MTNQLWIQEIEDNQCWMLLDNVCFSNGKAIYDFPWFDDIFDISKYTYQDIISDVFYFVIRTNRNHNRIFSFLRSLFLKLVEIDITEISSEDVEFSGENYKKSFELRVFVVEYKIIRPELWNEQNLAKMIYYIYVLSSLIDYPFGKGVIDGTTLGNVVFSIFQHDKHINTEKFFHSGLAKLLNSLIDIRQTSKRDATFVYDGPRFVSNDIEGIEFVLQSRENLNEALDRVDGFDVSKITDEILIQYDKMRRNF